MKTAASAIAIVAALALSPTAASAQDGSATGCIGPFPIIGSPCVTVPVDVAPNAIDRAELAPAVRTELDGLRTDTDTANTVNGTQQTEIDDLQTDLGTLSGTVVSQGNDIAALQTDKADVTYVDQKNQEQDDVINTKASQDDLDTVEQESKDRDTALDNKKVDKTRLDSFNGTGGSLETWATGVDATNATQTALLSQHSGQIAALEGDVSKLFKKNEQAFEGIAIALAMESPQVDPGKRFGISLNYGNFEGESALAAAAKLRFDDTWAGTAGVGYGMGRQTLGVRAGIQAQW